ncbi:unnamed protein product [Rhizophagus irregularis]|uniref:S-adenosyl-L-methionine-dependent methyltransferase n=1 Tax=Rhizophagus irregularis TaxID=588596 RepID=A0A2I1G3T0_9GLOM|nr:S-adenosyl-L-methionine-dependent methyltransferase [Rhizophagus irregularis]CAB4405431.1 unnamed protein product [Rhizophagus irregularis]
MKNERSNREFDSSDPLKSVNSKNILDSFRYFKGRRYHNLTDVTYLFPNDDKEVERLHLQHNICRFVWKNNFSSPIHELLKSGNAKVLDIGCGAGHWIIDMAKEYPQATFVGIDMSPIFPDVKDIPSNVIFLQLNLNDGIPFPNETFDFVFQRFLCNCVVLEKWKFYVKEMIRVTIPGGWLEFFEFEIDNSDKQLIEAIHSGFKAKGINSSPETCVPQFLEKCQELSKVHYKEIYIPIGDWAGPLGTMTLTYVSMNFETIRLLLTSAWRIDDESYDSAYDVSKLDFNATKTYIKSIRWFSKKN